MKKKKDTRATTLNTIYLISFSTIWLAIICWLQYVSGGEPMGDTTLTVKVFGILTVIPGLFWTTIMASVDAKLRGYPNVR